MQEIGKIAKEKTYIDKKGNEKQMDINVIPNNVEKYMAFMLGKHLTLIDSIQFMSSSLDKLVSNLPDDEFKYASKILKKKGIYPYDFMDSFEKINNTQLPSKYDFYSL